MCICIIIIITIITIIIITIIIAIIIITCFHTLPCGKERQNEKHAKIVKPCKSALQKNKIG